VVSTALLVLAGWWYLVIRPGDPGQAVYLTEVAPNVTLERTDGSTFDLAEHRGQHNVLFYFSEGIGCGACWDQIVDLEADWTRFADLDVELASVMIDPTTEVKAEANSRGIGDPIAIDPDKSASEEYGALEASMHPGVKPGHTFVLVNKHGRIIWRWDWVGHGKPMYMEVDELYDSVSSWLERAGDQAL
jgi:peroxiredoxin Q/BCP